MIKESELYTATLQISLRNDEKSAVYGTVFTRYEVRQVIDVRNLMEVRAYRITCTQRIVIPNQTQFSLATTNSTNFDNYPALLSSQFLLTAQADNNVRLLNYSPRTLNTTITASANQSEVNNQSLSRQHTTGSSTSDTNTFGFSTSAGFSGEAPTGSVDASYSHSKTNERSRSTTTGSDTGTSAEQGESDEMSVKDWASYAYLDPGNTSPSWVWGQEFPWDVIQFRYAPVHNDVQLPAFVEARLFETVNGKSGQTTVFPPSHLALFGIDFTMKAAWLVDLPSDLERQKIHVAHKLQYATASHGLDSNKKKYVQFFPVSNDIPFSSSPLDLTLLGLDPVRDGGAGNGAVIGFIPSKFIVPPKAGAEFKILSDANTLQVSGTGFDSPMVTAFDKGAVTLKVQFKVIDTRYSYALFLKHWKTMERGCTLSCVFNGDTANPVTRHINWREGEGGDDNLSSVTMRNEDYTTIDYHDYLVMGLNTIDITIVPDEPGESGYVLRALAISEG